MFREVDSFVFQRITGGIRKPIVRLSLPAGREVELLGFHLEPAWAFAGQCPRLAVHEVVKRLYPNQQPIFVGVVDEAAASGYLCAAYLFSDGPTRRGRDNAAVNYSVLLVCGLVENIEKGIRTIVAELLSQVDWDAFADDDFLW
jgi:hypothetical protein